MSMLRISLALLTSMVAAPAFAQAPVWVPILVEHDRVDETLQTVQRLRRSLQARGITLLDPKEAAEKFEALESMPAVTVPEPKVQATRQAVINAAAEASKQNWAASEEKAQAFLALETLQRDFVTWRAGLSERLFAGMCVTRVDGLLKEGRDDQAVLKAEECLGAYPGMFPEHHPSPEVLDAFKRARDKRTRNGEAELVVTMGEPTDGCTATLNGRPVGELPLRVPGLLPGFPVRVQVRCGHLGRVHAVRLEPGENVLVVSPTFDQAVVTDGYLGVRAAAASQRDYAARVGQALNAGAALLIGAADDSTVTVTMVALPGTHDTAELSIAGEGVDVEPLVPAGPMRSTAGPASGRLEETAEEKGGVPVLATVAVAAGGAVAYGLSWSYYGLRSGYRSEIASGVEEAAAAELLYDDAGQQAVVTGLLGAGLLSAAVPMALPEYDEAPALAWVGGGLGVAGLVLGGVLASQGQGCTQTSCDPDALDNTLGPIVMLQSVPLLAVPLTYAVRALLGSDHVDSEVQALPTGWAVRVRGAL